MKKSEKILPTTNTQNEQTYFKKNKKGKEKRAEGGIKKHLVKKEKSTSQKKEKTNTKSKEKTKPTKNKDAKSLEDRNKSFARHSSLSKTTKILQMSKSNKSIHVNIEHSRDTFFKNYFGTNLP